MCRKQLNYTTSAITQNEYYLANIFNNASISRVLINSIKFRYNKANTKTLIKNNNKTTELKTVTVI